MGVTVLGLIALAVIWLFSPTDYQRHRRTFEIKMEMTQLVDALERFRAELGQYPPASAESPESVKQFLAKAFLDYHGELPEKYTNLDTASSLVFWLGGMTDNDGKMIGFSTVPTNPFDTTNKRRIGPFFDFDPARLRNENGLSVCLPIGNSSRSDPYVYFRPDSKGEYHGTGRIAGHAAIHSTEAG